MIRFEKVFLRFDTGISLRELNFTIDQGEFLYLYGDSGSGKSSILKMIYMDLFPNSGTVSVLDFDSSQIKRRDIAIVRQKIGMVFQDFYLLSDRDIYSNIALPLEIQGLKADVVRRTVSLKADELGIRSRLSHYPHELSTGEQQRVALARAIVNSPDVLLVDEPLAHLDSTAAKEVVKHLWKINESGTSVIFATHNEKLLREDPARTMTLVSGEIVKDREA
ncbi:MAG: ATP-binding cassette domain-containing protein [Candidatus Marinimicrobia bacterium]|jgi:cell division transport system ATP-binding protein|nr:ATP-binding cassette domain-containing protein [Candidatus Neomarinimicrobiota bacterium]MBT3629888.1 ATP-binding cassette domain-containing protein [Candidatus Neomarinimicrobiota bacterium]MBT3823655.1 ATP-binding cassette domain-containing protein [Candidatus Neomarinimicrobiota bacterium]MBT4131028.1 ATP-binding cassette domain-containing protein [Candidatus Neomarinimicrobiota bacterium]MBT4295988.1 ATP-binding cassette domain-containing protein [Candidatus Neomarinimicrobiota bacterium